MPSRSSHIAHSGRGLDVQVLAPSNARRDGVRDAHRLVRCRRRRAYWHRLVVITVTLVVAAVNWGVKRRKRHEQARTVCVFEMERSNVNFVSLGDRLVASTKQLVFDGKLPFDGETRVLLCVGNESRWR